MLHSLFLVKNDVGIHTMLSWNPAKMFKNDLFLKSKEQKVQKYSGTWSYSQGMSCNLAGRVHLGQIEEA